MKGIYKAEAIGVLIKDRHTLRAVGIYAEVARSRRPWLAELTGLDDHFGYQREFIKARVDYTHANKKGTRGVWYHWTLETGKVYQTQHPRDWTFTVRKFLRVTDDGDVIEISEEEVRACLAR